MYDDIVFVKLGTTQKKFGVHRGLLTRASHFFHKALQADYVAEVDTVAIGREDGATVITLSNENPETFARINNFLYTRRFLNDKESILDVAWDHLIDVYHFSIRNSMTQLHNKCIDMAIMKAKNGGLFPSQATINALYGIELLASQLRKLLIKLFASRCNLKSAFSRNPNYHQAFVNSLVIELYEMAKDGTEPESLDLWTTRREYYATDSENPIVVD